MTRGIACALLFSLVLGAGASAVPLLQVRSAVGDVAPRNAKGPGEWLPQLVVNAVFRETLPAGGSLPPMRLTPVSVRVTELRPGEVRLVFVDAQRHAVKRPTFLTAGP